MSSIEIAMTVFLSVIIIGAVVIGWKLKQEERAEWEEYRKHLRK